MIKVFLYIPKWFRESNLQSSAPTKAQHLLMFTRFAGHICLSLLQGDNLHLSPEPQFARCSLVLIQSYIRANKVNES